MNLSAQKVSDYMFDRYLIKDGMSQSSPMSIYQDRVGYLWVGNQSGIDRFDGYTFKQYAHDKKNSNSRSSGWVLDITEDKDGNIWTTDNYGHFSMLERSTDKWINYTTPYRDSLFKANKNLPYYTAAPRSIYIDTLTNKIWLGTVGTGLVSYDRTTKIYERFAIHPESKFGDLISERVMYVRRFDKEKLLLATNVGLQYFDLKSKKISKVFNSSDSLFLVPINDIKIVGVTLYVANKLGAFIYNTKTKELTVFKHQEGNANSIASDNVNGIHYDKTKNLLWLTITGEGIDIINLSNQQIVHLNLLNAKDNGITESNYADIFEDKDHNIWVGSAISGLLKYDPGKRVIGLMNNKFPSDFNLGISSTWGMMVDKKGIIWLGEYISGGGVFSIDRKNKIKKSYLKNANGTTLRSWKFSEDAKGNIYAFTGNAFYGLMLYVKPFNKDVFTKVGNVNEILQGAADYVNGADFTTFKKEVILTGPKPIILADSNGKMIFKLYSLPKILEKGIFAIERKSPTELYVLNEDGIFILNEINNTAKPLTKGMKFDPSEDLYSGPSLHVVDNKMAFIASYGNGLVKVDLEKQTKVFLTLQDGIPNLYLYDIHSGKDNILWISSNYGIIRYNPYTNKFKTFGPEEGVQDYEFNTASSFKTSQDEIFFNGVSGLNYFYSDSIKVNTFPPNVIIQKFSTKDTVIFTESSNSTKPIEVEYKSNNLSFEFLAFNFRDASKNQYAYKMEGYDEDWIQVGSRRFASYTNLREGTYTFRVKAANSDGVWNEIGASMVIIIAPPIWRTWWAYSLYIVFLIAFIYVFAKFREKKQLKKLEDERKNGELAEAKALQERLLPKQNPTINHLDIATYLRTSTEIGGDYYDFFHQADGSLYAICGDATGHGTPSGMLVSITKAGIIGLPQMAPNKMLSALNTVVKKVDLGILRMSLNIAYLKDNQLTLSSAGMPPYFIYRAHNQSTEEIMLSGIPLGSFNKVEYDELTTEFNKGDILAIISDGLAEAPNAQGELFDYHQIQSIITENSHMNAETLINELMSQVDIWLAGAHNPDDITIVIIKQN
jgi:serine phosphatase RsbU (regulator of sigma subunit)/ligand-binding sensor domain-containing protein